MLKRISLSLALLFAFPAAALAQAAQSVVETSQYPAGATPITASATGSTGAVVATLAASATQRTYICGFSYTGTNATAAQNGSVTLTGVITATMTFGFPTLALGATVPQPERMVQTFYPCIPSSAINTAVAVNGPALGAGAPLATVTAWGFQL